MLKFFLVSIQYSNIPAFHFPSVFLLSLVIGELGYQRLSSALRSCGQDENLLQLIESNRW